MNPKATLGLTFIGVILAGVPLLTLTAEPTKKDVCVDALKETPSTQTIYTRVQFTGAPQSCILRYEGEELAAMPQGSTSPWELELNLPGMPDGLELEAEVTWQEGAPENAVSITLEPAQKEARTETRWTGPDGSLLHDLFIYQW